MASGELILRGTGVVLLVATAILMLRARRRDHAACAGAGLALSVACFLVTSMSGASRFLGVLECPLTAVCSTHPVWFWLACTALFSDGFRFARVHVVSLAGMAVLGVTYQAFWGSPAREQWPVTFETLGLLFALAALVFIALGPLAVLAGRGTDLDARRRQLRSWFVPVVCLYLAAVAVTQAARTFFGTPVPDTAVVLNVAFIDLIALAVLTSFLRVRVVNWLDLSVRPAPEPEALSRVEQAVLDRLHHRFVPERLYAREALTVASLAAELGTQEHVLRRAIHRGLGFRNFNDFLHSHRLREAAQRLRDPAQRRIPVLTVALESGYGSIGPFNRAFKAHFGMTPTEYRRSSLEGEPLGEVAGSLASSRLPT